MQLTQGLKIYQNQFGHSVGRLKRWMGRAPLIAVAFLVLIVASWEFGFRNGRAVAYDSNSQLFATHLLMWEKRRMEGQAHFAEQMIPRNADFAVRRHVELADASGFRGAFDRLLRGREWMSFGPKANEQIRSVANLRLATAIKPRHETLEALRRMKASDFVRIRTAEYQSTAEAYSKTLGRVVLPEELLTDADLRFQIENLKSFAGVKDPGDE